MKSLLTTAAIILAMSTAAMANPINPSAIFSGERFTPTHGINVDACFSELAKAKPIAERAGTEANVQIFVLPDGTYRAFSQIKNGRGEVMGPELTFIVHDNCDVQLVTK